MEKKISFGFSKVKKTNIFINKLAPKADNKIELIKCLEGQSIQLVEEKIEEAPLIIPLKDNRKTSAALLSLRTRQAVLNGEQVPADEDKEELPVDLKASKSNGNEVDDIEKRAAKELLAEISKDDNENGIVSTLVLPVKAEDLPLDGAKESTINDYESIPITQFGLAMLRGMGWKDQPKKKGAAIDDGPIMRPKGMGLGADKALKPKALLIPPDANEVLEIKKGACVRVLGGKHKDLYGQIEGMDDHAGRVIVKMALGSTRESFNEFLVQPVSKKEYAQYSKCINSAKYDEYKRLENDNGQIIIKKEERDNLRLESSHHSKHRNDERDQKHDRTKVPARPNSYESVNYPRKTERRSRSHERREDEHSRSSTSHKKYSNRRSTSRNRGKSDDSRSSDSSTYRSKHKKKSSKSKKSKKSKDKSRERRHSEQASSEDDRRHKKKTKKSKRERSRSRSKGRR